MVKVLKRGKCIWFGPHMMARFISNSNTLLRHSRSLKSVLPSHRHRSSDATNSKWLEIDGLNLFDDHVHRLMVKNATPDWLPFLPGSSFWVPPPPSPFLHKFSISPQLVFLQGSESESESESGKATPRGIEVTVQLKLLTPTEHVSLSEDDEG